MEEFVTKKEFEKLVQDFEDYKNTMNLVLQKQVKINNELADIFNTLLDERIVKLENEVEELKSNLE